MKRRFSSRFHRDTAAFAVYKCALSSRTGEVVTSANRCLLAVIALFVIAVLLATASLAGGRQSNHLAEHREMAIFQALSGETKSIPYQVLTRLDGEIWFRVGPYVAGEPLIVEFRSSPAEPMLAHADSSTASATALAWVPEDD